MSWNNKCPLNHMPKTSKLNHAFDVNLVQMCTFSYSEAKVTLFSLLSPLAVQVKVYFEVKSVLLLVHNEP